MLGTQIQVYLNQFAFSFPRKAFKTPVQTAGLLITEKICSNVGLTGCNSNRVNKKSCEEIARLFIGYVDKLLAKTQFREWSYSSRHVQHHC